MTGGLKNSEMALDFIPRLPIAGSGCDDGNLRLDVLLAAARNQVEQIMSYVLSSLHNMSPEVC